MPPVVTPEEQDNKRAASSKLIDEDIAAAEKKQKQGEHDIPSPGLNGSTFISPSGLVKITVDISPASTSDDKNEADPVDCLTGNGHPKTAELETTSSTKDTTNASHSNDNNEDNNINEEDQPSTT